MAAREDEKRIASITLTIEFEMGRGMMSLSDITEALDEIIEKAREQGHVEKGLLTFTPPLAQIELP